jgi:hypothetical protein
MTPKQGRLEMPLQNQVAVTFTPEQLEQIRTAITTLNTVLKPQLVQLGPQSRMELAKMGDKTIGFVSKTLEHARNNPDLTPRYFNLDDADIDFHAVTILREFSGSLGTLSEMLQDTMTLSGSEAYTASLAFYNSVKNAAKDEQPGAKLIYDDLKARFPRGITVPSTPEPVTA